MPALCAAAGSFQVKSPVTYLITALTTVCALPFTLTVVLIFFVTLFVSTLGARSYSDQRYASMQISGHSSAIPIGRATDFGNSVPSFDVDTDASCVRVWDFGKGAWDISASETPAGMEAVSGGSGSAVAVLPSATPIA